MKKKKWMFECNFSEKLLCAYMRMKSITKQKMHLHEWRRRESECLAKSIQIWLASKTLKKNRKTENESDENQKESARREISYRKYFKNDTINYNEFFSHNRIAFRINCRHIFNHHFYETLSLSIQYQFFAIFYFFSFILFLNSYLIRFFL